MRAPSFSLLLHVAPLYRGKRPSQKLFRTRVCRIAYKATYLVRNKNTHNKLQHKLLNPLSQGFAFPHTLSDIRSALPPELDTLKNYLRKSIGLLVLLGFVITDFTPIAYQGHRL